MMVAWTLAIAIVFQTRPEPEVERLIDAFAASPGSDVVNADAFEFACDEFIPVKTVYRQPLSTGVPQVDATMEQLERLGVRALPALLEHLDDPRKSVFEARDLPGAIMLFFGEAYHPRFQDNSHRPPGVVIGRTTEGLRKVPGQRYTLRVGDLCFGVIGQIVNRGLEPVQGVPEASTIVNSPIQWPALAEATRSDWLGLTAAAHERDLERSAIDPYIPYPMANEALLKLCFYYPDDGERVAVKLLNRSLFNLDQLHDMLYLELLKSESLTGSRRFYGNAVARFGDQTLTALGFIFDSQVWENIEDGERLKRRATEILRDIDPKWRPRSAGFMPIADLASQAGAATAVGSLHTEGTTRALVSLFERAEKVVPRTDESIPALWLNSYLDEVGIACYDHEASRGRDRFRAYFRRRIAVLGSRRGRVPDSQFLQQMKDRL